MAQRVRQVQTKGDRKSRRKAAALSIGHPMQLASTSAVRRTSWPSRRIETRRRCGSFGASRRICISSRIG
jgi:hypothetical protein